MNRIVRKCFSGCVMALVSGMMLSCLPEDDFRDIEIMAPSPSASLPLLNTSLVLSDLITVDQNNSMLIENEDKSYSLYYRTQVQSQPVGEFFPKVPEQNYSKSFSLGLNAPAFGWSTKTTFNGEIPLQLSEFELYKLESRQGDLTITLRSDYQHDIKVDLTLPNIQDANGNATQLQFDLKYSLGNNSSTKTIPLKEYGISISDSRLSYEMAMTIEGSGKPISSTDEVSFDFKMAGIEFSYIEGNFAGIKIPVQADSLDIPLLASAINGNIALNPSLNMTFSNSFGVGILPDLSNIYVKRKSGSVRLQDKGSSQFFSGSFALPYPESRNAGAASKTQSVDENNSNIKDAFAELPKGVAYAFGFAMESAAGDTSFVTSESAIGVDLEVELPLEGSFNILLEDTVAVNFASLSDNLEELKILIKTENSFPIDAKMQVYFLDEKNSKITDDSGQPLKLFEDGVKLLHAADIISSSTGETQPQHMDMPLAATINNTKYNLLEKTKHFLVQVDLNSVSEQNNWTKLYSFYGVRLSLAMQVKPSYN